MVIRNGRLIAWLNKTRRHLTSWAETDDTPDLVKALSGLAQPGRSLLLQKINGLPAKDSPLAEPLLRSGFLNTSQGLLHKGVAAPG